jgi:hypothetical protein
MYGVYWFSTKNEDDLIMWLECIKTAAKKNCLESPSVLFWNLKNSREREERRREGIRKM